MKNVKKIAIAVALLSTTSYSAAASDIDWDQIGAGYESLKLDDTDIKLTGLSINGTKTLTSNTFVTASYSVLSDDIAGFGEVELDQLQVGVGGIVNVSRNFDLYAQVSYLSLDASLGGASATDDGWSALAGARYAVNATFELAASIERMDVDGEKDTKFTGEARLIIAPKVALVGKISRYEDANSMFLGASYYF